MNKRKYEMLGLMMIGIIFFSKLSYFSSTTFFFLFPLPYLIPLPLAISFFPFISPSSSLSFFHIHFCISLSFLIFNSVNSQSCLTLCDPKDCNTPGFPVHHQLRDLSQTHVHLVGDVSQPSHPLSSLSPPAFNVSQG